MNTRLDIEVYKESDFTFCAYIGEAGSSGYECYGNTPEECAEQVKGYIVGVFNRNG